MIGLGWLLNRLVVPLVVTLTTCHAVRADIYQNVFRDHCIKCHGSDSQEANLRLDTIDAPVRGIESLQVWSTIFAMIDSGEMPPADEPSLDPVVKRKLLDWIGDELSRNSDQVPALRRMNRMEYENTVHDLLNVDTPLAELLPADDSVQGFDNVASGLGISSILLSRYLEAANEAFEGTIRRIQPLPPQTRRAVLMEQQENISSVKQKKGGVIETAGAFVDFAPAWPPARVDPAHPIEEGVYRCRVAVFPHDPGEHRTLSVAVFTGPLFGDGKRHFQGMFDVTGTATEPRIIEFTTQLGELHALHILPWIYPEHVTWRDKEESRPGVAIAWAETYGPLDQTFPSPASEKLFGPFDDAATIKIVEGGQVYIRHRRGAKSHFVDSTDPRADAARIVSRLASRAFRRPVEDNVTDSFVALTLARLDQGSTFEQAVQAGVVAILCSPHFLLLNSESEVNAYTVASRLSYFLWSSMPDDELWQRAADGSLNDPAVLHAQVDRMIDDPKIERFVESFTGQWLDLRDIEFTTPDPKLYPEYDELLLRSMLAETRGFFRHLLANDLSVKNFIDSDFACLNQRMAAHYGIPDVQGHEEFRIVQLPEDSIRGGILTHASVLKVTANGTTTSPVLRGNWVLENILCQPSPPPPPGVSLFEPDIRGATTIREQLDLHRSNSSCARCHNRIDPPGFALEEFDVIGGHREWYRTLSKGGKQISKTNYYVGPTVEQGGVLADGQRFADFVEFRQRLLERPEMVASAVATKLLVYGSGRPVRQSDRSSVTAVVDATRDNDFGLRSMVHAVVDSELFHQP